jgi:hypothetical protein
MNRLSVVALLYFVTSVNAQGPLTDPNKAKEYVCVSDVRAGLEEIYEESKSNKVEDNRSKWQSREFSRGASFYVFWDEESKSGLIHELQGKPKRNGGILVLNCEERQRDIVCEHKDTIVIISYSRFVQLNYDDLLSKNTQGVGWISTGDCLELPRL